MAGDAWRKKITQDSGKELDAIMDDEGREEGEEDDEEDEEDEFEDVEGDWDELEKLEAQVDSCIAGNDEQGGPDAARKLQGADEDVVVIGDDSGEEEGARGDEWEEVSVGADAPKGAHVRKATKQERIVALHIHRVQLVCLLSRGVLFSNLCDGSRVRFELCECVRLHSLERLCTFI